MSDLYDVIDSKEKLNKLTKEFRMCELPNGEWRWLSKTEIECAKLNVKDVTDVWQSWHDQNIYMG